MAKKKKGKKSNKKSINRYYTSYYTTRDDDKKGKKVRDERKGPKMKTVRPSLDKKEAKENKKILLQPIEIPKEFRKNRERCNHANGMMSVADYKKLTPNHSAFTPMLDALVAQYGEDHVAVCSLCYDVVVKPMEAITSASVATAKAILYACANRAVQAKRLGKDEIKEIASLKESLAAWDEVGDIIDEAKLLNDAIREYKNSGNELSAEDARILNQAGSRDIPTIM